MSQTTIPMSQKEIDRHDIILRVIRKELTGVEAATLLKLSPRQIKRLKAAVRECGAQGLIHGNRGQRSNRRIPEKEQVKIAKLLHKHYWDFKPTHASEKLRDVHKIVRDPKTIRRIMIEEELWKPRRGRKKQTHRSWRARKPRVGQMQQFDGSYHDWFEGRDGIGEACLLLSVDDATGRITRAQFVKDEGVLPVFAFWRDYILEHGKPRSIYVDKFSTYKMNQQVAKANHDTRTRFQRAMAQLHIEDISAHSPEAKGRVERIFETLQDRLVKEMRLLGISRWEEGNLFLTDMFIPWFNKRYGVTPQETGDLHTPLTKQEKKQLDSIFSRRSTRVVNNDFTLSFDNTWYQLTKGQPVTICKKDKVTIEERLDGSFHVRLKNKSLNYQILPARPKRPKKTVPWILEATSPTQKTNKPAVNHPWRKRIHADALQQ
jgi:hypothetical protein